MADGPNNADHQFKLILIGDAKVGKSCFLHHFVTRRFKTGSKATLGVEFGSQLVDVAGKSINLRVWDTAGNERFRSITRTYYRNAVGVLVFYDITSRRSFDNVAQWVADARKYAVDGAVVMLVGNKKDLCDEGDSEGEDNSGEDDDESKSSRRAVELLESSAFAMEHGLLFLETSALTGENVVSTFLRTARAILEKVDSGKIKLKGANTEIQAQWPQSETGAQDGGCGC